MPVTKNQNTATPTTDQPLESRVSSLAETQHKAPETRQQQARSLVLKSSSRRTATVREGTTFLPAPLRVANSFTEALARAGLSGPDRIPLGMADDSFVARRREAWGNISLHQSLYSSASQPMYSAPQTKPSFIPTPHRDSRVFGQPLEAFLQRSGIHRPYADTNSSYLSEQPSHTLAGAEPASYHAAQTAPASASLGHRVPFSPAASLAPPGNAIADAPGARDAFTVSAASAANTPTAPAVQSPVQYHHGQTPLKDTSESPRRYFMLPPVQDKHATMHPACAPHRRSDLRRRRHFIRYLLRHFTAPSEKWQHERSAQ